ncbi:hypothetical protein GCM10023187_02120 [Nibrella viscosa]|uniref:Chromosome partition protein Smc n=1 Tax=Nibrella viscosa TaxID=1084524 RepID=A0ABP8JSK5_9BACT
MEPLNKTERRMAFNRFLGVYCLSLSVPLLAAYLFFSIPDRVLKEENVRMRETLDEQSQRLLQRVSGVTTGLKTLETTDQAYLKATDIEKGSLKTQLSGLENEIQGQVNGIKADTVQFKPVNRQISKGLIGAYEAVLTYRNSIGYLRDMLDKKGIDADQVEKLSAALTQARQENEMLKLLAARNNAAPAPTPSSGGGGGGGNQYLAQLQDCNGKLTSAQSRIAQLENQLKNSSTPAQVQPVSTGVSKAEVEMDLVERCERKADDTKRPPLWRRPLYEFAVETLEQTSHPDAKQRITTIQGKLRRLGSD